MKPQNICVYCGSSSGTNPVYTQKARAFGTLLAEENVGLVYGGGGIGLMGEMARAALAAGGHVTGIIPSFLNDREIPLHEVSELVVTTSMHERKQLMFEKSDAFIAFPGGIGTIEETIEMMTWAQLGRHTHPIIFVNLEAYWDPLLKMLDHVIEAGFARSSVHSLYSVVDRIEDVLPRISAEL